ncbi:uncharacterized protein YaaN involved in tellurite resistance [Peribacillus deserti]|uniref:Uncharacterized protein YaaN involved in tellurite resistance n=1 Tax=Peribacillus deserti TaxID=673318 RepID=A0ABS2QKC8_9BACI|nr:toxic anion resistance protein [Peribacillus deserti]MBM7693622.1 uncharacterized protein YaaN involved in tellurite resistance [Peribacillus deserti]
MNGKNKSLLDTNGLFPERRAFPHEENQTQNEITQQADTGMLEEQIKIGNHQSVLSFGLSVQSELVTISNAMLRNVQKKDIGEIGDIIAELMNKLSEVDPKELKLVQPSFFARLLGRKSPSIEEVLSRFQKASAAIDRLSIKLDRGKEVLLTEFKALEKLYESNEEYFNKLNVYITAGETKLNELIGRTMPSLHSSAENTDDPMKKQEASGLVQFAELLDKRLYDLKISRELTIQSAAQIRMIQHSNQVLAEKIQSSIMTIIPLWKNQISTTVSLLRQLYSSEAQKRAVNTLKDGSLSVHSLKNIHENLLFQLKETLLVQEDERTRLNKAEMELASLDKGLNEKHSFM